MAEVNDVQVIANISTIVDESQIKVILLSQCIKAQASLFDKLRKRSDRQKETCSFINNANIKLKAEIQIAEQEIKSFLIAQETMKLGNIELKKELLLTKEKKIEIENRTKIGEKKYENLWQECKSRYESLPLVQKLLQGKNNAHKLNNSLVNSINQIETLGNDIKVRQATVLELDRSRILELAKYVSHEMIRKTKIIDEKSVINVELTNEIDTIIKENENRHKFTLDSKIKNNTQLCLETNKVLAHDHYPNFDKTMNDEQMFTMPKLQLANFDLDIINVKLEQVNTKKNYTCPYNLTPSKSSSLGPGSGITSHLYLTKDHKSIENEYLSLYFKTPNSPADEIPEAKNYSKRKLINILDDIKIHKNEAYEMISRADPDKFQTVNVVVAETASSKSEFPGPHKKPKLSQADTEVDTIEILTSTTDNILIPPSQFLDMTQDKPIKSLNRQDDTDQQSTSLNEDLILKENNAVSFDISAQDCIDNETDKLENDTEKVTGETLNNQPDTSVVSEEDFVNIKNRILKERQLDLSPQFVYAKNNGFRGENKIVTSKFFPNERNDSDIDIIIENKFEYNKNMDESEKKLEAKVNRPDMQIEKKEKKIIELEVCESQKLNQPVKGLLFTHGLQAIPDSLNVSINTTGCEDRDPEYPQFIDSNLLLSPKADLPMPTNSGSEIHSQEVPNFLSGLRKTGLSLFGAISTSDQNPEQAQNQRSLFNFNFGSDQKNKGGIFNMFN